MSEIQTIGGYEIKSELGRGGMGVVYKGWDRKLEREVAIKVVENIDTQTADQLTLTSHQELIERFKTEAKAIAKLSHPNIVNIYDFGVENDRNYMVMEFLKGRDLSQLLKFNSPLSVELVLKSIVQVCAALDYAHTTGIIHRDIKPANILLLDNGIVKLMDFGIARIQEAKSQLTQAGTILGSVLYISPEQLISAQKVDKRADIYSLGVSIYELLTGQFPYDGDNVASIISKIMKSEPEPPSFHNPKIPPELDEIIMRSIAKDPDHRYQRASELGDDLNEVLFKLKGGVSPMAMTSAGSSSSSTGLGKTSFARTLEFSLVEGVDKINLFSLMYRIIQTWSVENIGNKPILEALYGNESLSQAIVVSNQVILLSYKGLLIAAASDDPDEVGSKAYEVTADITKVDIKSCIPNEQQQDFLVVMSSILGNGIQIGKHLGCNSNDLENIMEKAKQESFTGHMEISDINEIKYKGFVDGREVFTLAMPNKKPSQNMKPNRMDIEVYEVKLKLLGPSLRRALIDTTIEIINKTHGSAASFKQLSLQKTAKIIPEFIEEAVRNTDLATLVSNDRVISVGKQSIKYSEVIEGFSAAALMKWIIKDLLIKVARSNKFQSIKNCFSWIWNLKTIKLAQQLKLNDGSKLAFDMISYNDSEKLSVVARYSSQGNVSELHNFIEDVVKLKKGIMNADIKAAVYISGNDFFPEVLKYYDKVTKKESLFAFSAPKAFIPAGGFYLFMIKEEQDGTYRLILPEVF
ncbi:MAG: serine/threonine-protein kinase [Candidatus Sericytochromatia bacterium]